MSCSPASPWSTLVSSNSLQTLRASVPFLKGDEQDMAAISPTLWQHVCSHQALVLVMLEGLGPSQSHWVVHSVTVTREPGPCSFVCLGLL